MLAVARRRFKGVQFQHGRFEDAELQAGTFDALVSASAFHWVDPAVGWRKAAEVLRPGGAIVLLTHMVVAGRDSAEAADRFCEIYARQTGAQWRLRTVDEALAEARARRDNVSAVWAVADGRPEVAEAARLFGPVTLEATTWEARYSADELIELQRTTASNLALDEARSRKLERELRELVEELGGVFPRTHLALAAVARRLT
jgi:SAM-dependent methyltransferase